MITNAIVIVGAGEAGARAAIELREAGWAGGIILIGKERLAPYERPPLSKEVMVRSDEPAPAWILNEDRIREYRIELVTDSEVTAIARDSKKVHLSDGREFCYDKLLLATGANPRKLQLEGSDTSGVLHLRTFAEALAIRSRLYANQRIVVIGGGFIGLEVASSAIERECDVTVLEVGLRILMRGVPREIADVIEARHREAGVRFKLGTGLERIEKIGEAYRITLADGSVMECETLIAGIGAVPEIGLAAACGLEIDNGIAVDQQLRTSDPNIYAAGDCCSFPHQLYDGQRIRLEAWRNAQDQGIVAARNLAGGEEAYSAVPWFWSDQYDLTLQVAGLPDRGVTKVERRMTDGIGRLFFHLSEDGTLLAASGIGSASLSKDIRIAEMLIERQAKPDPDLLADQAFKLKSLLNM
ncbi:NAD(P)/FAD-dependent oxidoreductase [Paenibacillus silvisoli]|uniref:NAD(P)/FAD-dependent oxidoreductase n=1 Tax=Paenibacillus silvisoli TaxID=3110539 RepID=UPI002805DC45|nr:FAD-dependent oxidoreductase [Paenibacillus silvisoli]